MTDRIHSLTVTLDDAYREDDIQPIINAIKMLKCVAKVNKHIANHETYWAETRARTDLISRIYEALREPANG
jgi:hypothetical protein